MYRGDFMKFKNNQKELDFMLRMVEDAENLINDNKVKVNDKGEDDLVTNLDLEIENYIISNIKTEFPNFSVVSEEFNSSNALTPNCFTIDPIDGTINFANGLANWAIEMACVKNEETAASVIYMPMVEEFYFAVKGEGAYLNDEKIKVKQVPINRSIYAICGTGNNIFEIHNKMRKHTKHYRALGAMSNTLAYTAKGAISGCILLSPTIWDLQPGLLLCKEAGAVIKRNEEKNFIVIGCNEEYANILYEAASEASI